MVIVVAVDGSGGQGRALFSTVEVDLLRRRRTTATVGGGVRTRLEIKRGNSRNCVEGSVVCG